MEGGRGRSALHNAFYTLPVVYTNGLTVAHRSVGDLTPDAEEEERLVFVDRPQWGPEFTYTITSVGKLCDLSSADGGVDARVPMCALKFAIK